jgi:hypothetical protein
VQVSGYAVDLLRSDLVESVWIRLDGRLYPATYGLDSEGVAALFRDTKYRQAGFSWIYPSWKLGTAAHTLSLVTFSKSGESYQEGPVIRFRMEPQ